MALEVRHRRARRLKMEKRHGLSNSYFAEIRKRQPVKYRYMLLYGYDSYDREAMRLRSVMAEIYYTLQPKRLMSDFYRSQLQDEYTTNASFIVSLTNLAFGSSDLLIKFPAFRRMKKIEKAYRRYKK